MVRTNSGGMSCLKETVSKIMAGEFTNIISEMVDSIIEEALLNDSLREAGTEPKGKWPKK